jgi:hypothetical protein
MAALTLVTAVRNSGHGQAPRLAIVFSSSGRSADESGLAPRVSTAPRGLLDSTVLSTLGADNLHSLRGLVAERSLELGRGREQETVIGAVRLGLGQ